jgi:hypothetical protein
VALSVTTRRRVWLEIGRPSEYGSVDLDIGWFAGIGGSDIDVPAGFTHEALEAQRVNRNRAEMTTTTLPQFATQDAHI